MVTLPANAAEMTAKVAGYWDRFWLKEAGGR
jgi:hypothetical protein